MTRRKFYPRLPSHTHNTSYLNNPRLCVVSPSALKGHTKRVEAREKQGRFRKTLDNDDDLVIIHNDSNFCHKNDSLHFNQCPLPLLSQRGCPHHFPWMPSRLCEHSPVGEVVLDGRKEVQLLMARSNCWATPLLCVALAMVITKVLLGML